MSSLHDYLLGQMQQTLHSLDSGQREIRETQEEQGEKIDGLAKKLDEALTWAQRLVLLGISLLGALGLNYSPDRIGEALATFLKALR